MSKERNPKLEKYIVYGMIIGLFTGSLVSLIGMLIESIFIQITGVGIGLSLGIIIGAIIFSIENNK